MIISSNKNEKIKELKKLSSEKGFLLLDNPKLILEAFYTGLKIEYLVLVEGFKNLEIENLPCNCRLEVSKSVFNSICSTVTSQGAVAVVKINIREFKPPSGNFLVLDCVQDPGNVGTLIRSAVAFDFNEIYLIDCSKISNEKVARSSMGAIFRANIYEISKETFLKNFKDANLVCGALGGKALNKQELCFPLGVVVGNEGKGISKEVLKLGKSVEIETSGNVESLNAGVAGSILMSYFYNKMKGEQK